MISPPLLCLFFHSFRFIPKREGELASSFLFLSFRFENTIFCKTFGNIEFNKKPETKKNKFEKNGIAFFVNKIDDHSSLFLSLSAAVGASKDLSLCLKAAAESGRTFLRAQNRRGSFSLFFFVSVSLLLSRSLTHSCSSFYDKKKKKKGQRDTCGALVFPPPTLSLSFSVSLSLWLTGGIFDRCCYV